MGIRSNNRIVDFDKLYTEFKKRDVSANAVATQLGRAGSYFHSMRKKGYLPEATLIMLDTLWNIKYESIKPTAEAEEPTVAEQPEKNEANEVKEPTAILTKEELRYIITEAVKDAFMWYANR